MSRSRTLIIALDFLAVVGVCAAVCATRSAHAQAVPVVRDFFGEADQDVTAVTAVPQGMVCGSLSVGNGLTVQTSEPPGGFTGACLMNRAYGATLPTVCYSPSKATYSSQGGSVQCSVPASSVVQPDWHINVNQSTQTITRQYLDGYQVLETCTPHQSNPGCAGGSNQNGNCPCNTAPVSNSCCTHYGVEMTSSDGQTATGTGYFTPTPSASADAATP